jgi:hypothetical protein
MADCGVSGAQTAVCAAAHAHCRNRGAGDAGALCSAGGLAGRRHCAALGKGKMLLWPDRRCRGPDRADPSICFNDEGRPAWRRDRRSDGPRSPAPAAAELRLRGGTGLWCTPARRVAACAAGRHGHGARARRALRARCDSSATAAAAAQRQRRAAGLQVAVVRVGPRWPGPSRDCGGRGRGEVQSDSENGRQGTCVAPGCLAGGVGAVPPTWAEAIHSGRTRGRSPPDAESRCGLEHM